MRLVDDFDIQGPMESSGNARNMIYQDLTCNEPVYQQQRMYWAVFEALET